MPNLDTIPNMPSGVRWDHTTVSATARMDDASGYQPGHITVEVYLDLVPGTLPDAKAYTSSRWTFRPLNVRARYTDGKLEALDVEGQRVTKDGGIAQRQPQSYRAYSGEIKRTILGEDTAIPGGPIIIAALSAYLVAHPLPDLHLTPGRDL